MSTSTTDVVRCHARLMLKLMAVSVLPSFGHVPVTASVFQPLRRMRCSTRVRRTLYAALAVERSSMTMRFCSSRSTSGCTHSSRSISNAGTLPVAGAGAGATAAEPESGIGATSAKPGPPMECSAARARLSPFSMFDMQRLLERGYDHEEDGAAPEAHDAGGQQAPA